MDGGIYFCKAHFAWARTCRGGVTQLLRDFIFSWTDNFPKFKLYSIWKNRTKIEEINANNSGV